MMKLVKVAAILTLLSLLGIWVAGCTAENTTPAGTTPTSTPPASTAPPVTTMPPASTVPATTPPPTRSSALVSISVDPAYLTVETGVKCLFTVEATYADGQSFDVTQQCTYASSDSYLAYVVTHDMPVIKASDKPIPGWYIQIGPVGSVRINISYTENGITKTTFIPITIERLPGG
jgi:hypothetical protein